MDAGPQGRPLSVPKHQLKSARDYIADVVAGKTSQAAEVFVNTQLPPLTAKVLSSACVTPDGEATVFAFLCAVCDLVASRLASARPLAAFPGAATLLGRLFLCDPKCNYFWCNHGAVAQRSPEAMAVNGAAARVPPGGASKYLVAVVNRFSARRGFANMAHRVRGGDGVASMQECVLYMQVVFACRYVLAKEWSAQQWPVLQLALQARAVAHPSPLAGAASGAVGNPLAAPVTADLAVACLLFQIDAVGRLFRRTYLRQWEWTLQCDVFATYNLNRALLLLTSEQPALAAFGATFLASFLKWALSLPWLQRLEPARAVAAWLYDNNVPELLKEAVDACVPDADADADERADDDSAAVQHLYTCQRAVSRFLSSVQCDTRVACSQPVKLHLKTGSAAPSFATMHLVALDPTSVTLAAVVHEAARLLRLPPSAVVLECRSGAYVDVEDDGGAVAACMDPGVEFNLIMPAERARDTGFKPGVATMESASLTSPQSAMSWPSSSPPASTSSATRASTGSATSDGAAAVRKVAALLALKEKEAASTHLTVDAACSSGKATPVSTSTWARPAVAVVALAAAAGVTGVLVAWWRRGLRG